MTHALHATVCDHFWCIWTGFLAYLLVPGYVLFSQSFLSTLIRSLLPLWLNTQVSVMVVSIYCQQWQFCLSWCQFEWCNFVLLSLPVVWTYHPWPFCPNSWCSCCIGCWGSLAICGHAQDICMACCLDCHFFLCLWTACCGIHNCCCACWWYLSIYPWHCCFSLHACDGVPHSCARSSCRCCPTLQCLGLAQWVHHDCWGFPSFLMNSNLVIPWMVL